ncbi:MAG: Glu-tRNA(Gln) amidotransferase subunit GatD [Candidatus Diapherotrites archaeon]|nr:Glu-tRNA(Gln) amidotransferase subunit GatD [Candidatus Diapherotrites archaeon]
MKPKGPKNKNLKNDKKEGSLVRFNFEGKIVEGTVIPSRSKELMIKMASGYNAGFDPSKIKSLEKLGESKSVGKPKTVSVPKKEGLSRISILHTGGTIASRVNYATGGVYASFNVEDLVTMFPELFDIANIESVFVSNMMSEDMTIKDYQKIAKAVEGEIKKGARGIIIGHGTDTLGYSAAALAFMLENCPVPVLIVGAQRSSDRGSSDAGMNLICAAAFIAKSDFKGVAVCMHNSTSDNDCAILPAAKTRKMHTSRRDAFKAINDTPIALVNYRTKEIKWLKDKKSYVTQKEKFLLKDKFEEKVGIVKMYPGISKKIIEFYMKEKYRGLILEGTGLGHTPIGKNDEFVKEIAKLVESGCVVGMTSQCINGRVHPSVYTNLRKVASTGVIYCEDMLPETAFIKLSWLLGNYGKKEVEQKLNINLRGEITDFSRTDTYKPEM